MKKIAVVTNYNITDKIKAADIVIHKLLEFEEVSVYVPVYGSERVSKDFQKNERVVFTSMEEVYSEAELVIVLGGDGSILEAARRLTNYGTPILGINLGHLGFMAELEMNELNLLDKYFSGEYEIEARSMLSVELIGADGKSKTKAYALNDAVVSNGSISRIVDLELYDDENLVASLRSDGIIVATPTGSTAYSMSAGGPIISPVVKCLCVTPICSHSLTTRPVIFPEDSNIRIRNISKRERMLYVTLDGRNNYEMLFNDSIIVTKSEKATNLVRLKKYDFYNKLHQKMSNQ